MPTTNVTESGPFAGVVGTAVSIAALTHVSEVPAVVVYPEWSDTEGVTDFVETAVNVVRVPAGPFDARPPLHMNSVEPDATPLIGAWITRIVVELVPDTSAPRPGAEHETTVDVTNMGVLAVIVMLSPPTSVSEIPMLKMITDGTTDAAVVLTAVGADHVRRPVVEYPVCHLTGTIEVDETASKVTVVTESPSALRLPVHTIVALVPSLASVGGLIISRMPFRFTFVASAAVPPSCAHVHLVGELDHIAELAVSVIVSVVAIASVMPTTNVTESGVDAAAFVLSAPSVYRPGSQGKH